MSPHSLGSHAIAAFWAFVKNVFSKLTKVQISWGQHRIDVTNDHWEKALKEGCDERKQAQMGMSLIEKTNTK